MLLSMLFVTAGCSLNSNRLEQTTTRNATVVTEVKAALIREPDIDAAAIRLRIVDGQLQIDGFVETEEESQLVVEIASETADAMNVLNKLVIR